MRKNATETSDFVPCIEYRDGHIHCDRFLLSVASWSVCAKIVVRGLTDEVPFCDYLSFPSKIDFLGDLTLWERRRTDSVNFEGNV
jgi:hypothetical protein